MNINQIVTTAVLMLLAWAAGYLLRPADAPKRTSRDAESPVESPAAAENRTLRAEVDSLKKQIALKERGAVAAASAAPADSGSGTPAAEPKDPRYVVESFEKGLKSVNWEDAGGSVANMLPLLDKLATDIGEGKPVAPSASEEIQKYNRPLIVAALTLQQGGLEGTGANGTFTHPLVTVNLVYSTLSKAGAPLDAAQEKSLGELGFRFIEEDKQRRAAYNDDTFEFRKVLEEAELKDRLFHEIDALLSSHQRDLLHSPAVRDRLSIDLFCSGLVWVQVTRRLQFRQNEELKGEASRQWVRAIGLLDASLPALGAALDEWVLGFPEGYLAEKSDALAMGGMERLDRLRVASRRQLVFMEALPARMQLTPEQVVKLREAPVLLLPFRME